MTKINKYFYLDWRYCAEDVLWNAEKIVGKLPIEFVGEREIFGDMFEILKANGKEYKFEVDKVEADETTDRISGILDLINRFLSNKAKRFQLGESDGDCYKIELVNYPQGLSAKSKYFILYFITSRDPVTTENLYLTLGENKFYASKVDPGETLTEVLDREIPELTGSEQYILYGVRQEYDKALDKFGKEITRIALDIYVPYFDPKITKTKYPMEWIKESALQ